VRVAFLICESEGGAPEHPALTILFPHFCGTPIRQSQKIEILPGPHHDTVITQSGGF
jgi:hypothetical protein